MRAKNFVGLLFYPAIVVFVINCRHNAAEKPARMRQMPTQTIEQVQAKYQDQWMAIPGVAGVGIGAAEGKPAILVLVIKKTSELEQKIPKMVEGYAVVIEETGQIRALKRDSG